MCYDARHMWCTRHVEDTTVATPYLFSLCTLRNPDSAKLAKWTPSKELRDTLVDMYTDNPKVNEELRQRLPSNQRPVNPHSSVEPSVFQLPLETPHSSIVPFPAQGKTSCLVPSRKSGVVNMETDFSDLATETCEGPLLPTGECLVSSHRDVGIGHTVTGVQAQDEDKKVSLLLRELDALRDINMKLLDQLSLKEEELHKKELEMMAETLEFKAWEKPSEFLDELLSARKNRDEAMMSRVLLANQERDEALSRVARLQQAAECDPIDTSFGDSDSEMEEILQRVCNSACAQEVARLGSVLVERVRSEARRRRDITTQEMKAVMDERDGSLAKCRRLQQEVMQEREQRVNKEELIKLQRERDAAVDDRKRLEAELQLLRANYSSEDLVKAPPPMDGPAPPLLSQLRQLTEDKREVEAELLRCREAERDARERVHRLERLVEVLRKKVGTGSLRAVV
ncbi:mirror-image polydactyly gene 1 protein [Corythoichthys intestinalis]|uniref:mirror-image polydactyly gene 1 protein n=1 Tax=Corythoichthys intestinalis TaxID=161448 RepID=UPI0025A65398|nr:mirror-image polydactyly gene 1 protein [Corythoichthys intestinalis]